MGIPTCPLSTILVPVSLGNQHFTRQQQVVFANVRCEMPTIHPTSKLIYIYNNHLPTNLYCSIDSSYMFLHSMKSEWILAHFISYHFFYPLVNIQKTMERSTILKLGTSTISTGPWLQVRKLLTSPEGISH